MDFTSTSRRYNSSSSIEEILNPSERMEEEEPEIIFMSQPINGTSTKGVSSRRRRGPRKSERKRAQQRNEDGTDNTANGMNDFEDEDLKQEEIILDGSMASAGDSESAMDAQTVILSDSEDDPIILDLSESQENPAKQESTSGIGDSSFDDPMSCADQDDIKEVTPPEVVASNNAKKIAEERRRTGNMFFQNQEYHRALDLYNQAIDAVPDDACLYSNRSACYLMLKKYKDAQADARRALQLNPSFDKGYTRLIRSCLALGDVIGTESALQAIKSLDVLPDTTAEEGKLHRLRTYLKDLEVSKEKKDYRKVLFLSERAIEIAEGDLQLRMVKANSLLKLERFTEALDLCTEVLQLDSMCVEGYYVRAICFYCQDNIDKAIQFLKQALQFAPDNTACLGLFRQFKKFNELRTEASGLFSSGKYSDSKVKYKTCLEALKSIEYTNKCIESKMYMNLSLISQKLNETDDALTFINKAIDLNPNYLKAFKHRASVHLAKEKYDEAVRDYESAQKLDPGTDYKKYIHDTKMAAKRAKRKDYYKILGVGKNATGDEVKKAYKKRALIHHPDRHSSATDEVKKEQEMKFKELGEAYDVLSDQKKRDRYDAGHDLLEGDYSSPYDFPTNDLFNVFFGGGGMGGHSRSFNSGFRQSSYGRGNYHPY